MNGLLTILLLFVIVVAAFMFPVAVIWALNTLGILSITLTWKTYWAVIVLLGALSLSMK